MARRSGRAAVSAWILAVVGVCLGDAAGWCASEEKARLESQRWEKKGGGVYCHCEGPTSYPDRVVLFFQLRLGSEVVEGSLGRARVKGGRFAVDLGPFSRPLFCGDYVLDVFFTLQQQPATLYYEIEEEPDSELHLPVRIGSAEDEARETEAFKKALTVFLTAAQEALTELEKAFTPAAGRDIFPGPETRRFDPSACLDFAADLRSRVPGLRDPLRSFTEGVGAPKCPAQCLLATRFLSDLQTLADLQTLSAMEGHGLAAPQELLLKWDIRPGIPVVRRECQKALDMLRYFVNPVGKDPGLDADQPAGLGGLLKTPVVKPPDPPSPKPPPPDSPPKDGSPGSGGH